MMEQTPDKPTTALTAAVEQFLAAAGVREGTLRNYRRICANFLEVAKVRTVANVQDVTLELIEVYRNSREIEPSTWLKELEFLRGFFGYCHDRGWITGNPAKLCRTPKVEVKPVEPYTQEEFIRMLAACETFGQQNYERTRAKAMLLVLRHTALRISDVALLKRSCVKNGSITVRTIKNSKDVNLPVPKELQAALDSLPDPKEAGPSPEYYFWSGRGTERAMVRGVDRTLRRVFLKSGVPGAHAHRFRHTLATELLEDGVSFEDVASILGSSPAIIRKHYAQWSPKRQERIENLMRNRVVLSGKDTIVTQAQTASAIC